MKPEFEVGGFSSQYIQRKKIPVIVDCFRKLEAGAGLTPENVLASATEKKSPLHDLFEWDNSAAADAYRLGQAAALIRHIKVHVITASGDHTVRAFVNVNTKDDTSSYLSIQRVLSDEELRAQLLGQANRDAAIFQQKYSVLRELEPVFKALRVFIKKTKQT